MDIIGGASRGELSARLVHLYLEHATDLDRDFQEWHRNEIEIKRKRFDKVIRRLGAKYAKRGNVRPFMIELLRACARTYRP